MSHRPQAHPPTRTGSPLASLILIVLLIIYSAGMMVLPVYFFGLQLGLWLSGALLLGGLGVLVVLADANRNQEPPPRTSSGARIFRAAAQPEKSWARPRVIPFN